MFEDIINSPDEHCIGCMFELDMGHNEPCVSCLDGANRLDGITCKKCPYTDLFNQSQCPHFELLETILCKHYRLKEHECIKI